MSPQAGADASPTSDPKHFCDCGTASLPSLPPLSPLPAGPDLPSATLKWLYPTTQNQPHCVLEMPPLWKMLCKWLRVAYSNYVCKFRVLFSWFFFHVVYESHHLSSHFALSLTPTAPLFSLSGSLFLPFLPHLFCLVSWCSHGCV